METVTISSEGIGRNRLPITAVALRAHELRHKPYLAQPPNHIPEEFERNWWGSAQKSNVQKTGWL
jgi:hypothetical protein